MVKKKSPEYVKEMCQRVIDRIDEELLKPEPYISDEDRKNEIMKFLGKF